MNSKNTIYVCMMSILLLMATQVRSQTTHIVDNNPNTAADFMDLQNAINAAADNDTIYVQQSDTGYGDITLDKSLAIIGRSHNDSSYKSQVNDITIPSDGSSSTIKGLDIGHIIDDIQSSSSIINLAIIDCDIFRVDMLPNPNFGFGTINNIIFQGNVIRQSFFLRASNTIVQNNIFTSDSNSSPTIRISPGNTIFSNNIIVHSGNTNLSHSGDGLLTIDNCIFVSESSSVDMIIFDDGIQNSVEVRNSITYNYGSGDFNFETGNNITLTNNQENVDPLLTFLEGSSGSLLGNQNFEPELDDLTLQPNSPVVDDGLYEGYDFKPLGTPTGLPSVKIDAYDATVPVNGDLNVTIKAKAN